MTHKTLTFLAARSDKIAAAAGVTLVAIAIGMTSAVHSHSARAATALTDTASTATSAMILPPLQVFAAADTATSDAAPEGFRAKMRERMQDRMQERKKEFEKEHPPIDKKLTHDQARDIVAGRLAMSGNPNLKVGKVTAKEDGIVAIEITTKTGALVDTREISTKTGLPAGLEQGGARMGNGRFNGGGRMMRHGFQRSPFAERHGEQQAHRDLALTTDQAKKLAEARLIMMGNKNLKVGAVKEKDLDTISVDIVASDNSLVVQRLINRHSGRPMRNS